MRNDTYRGSICYPKVHLCYTCGVSTAPDHDYDAIARDLVRALRGGRSQVAFARRLGFRSNAVYTWESGRRWPAASVFLDAAERVGIDVRLGLRGFLRRDLPWLEPGVSSSGVL